MLHVESIEEHRDHFVVRDAATGGVRALDKYIDGLDEIRELQDLIVERAVRYDVPVIESTTRGGDDGGAARPRAQPLRAARGAALDPTLLDPGSDELEQGVDHVRAVRQARSVHPPGDEDVRQDTLPDPEIAGARTNHSMSSAHENCSPSRTGMTHVISEGTVQG